MPAYNAGRTLRLTYEQLPKDQVSLVIPSWTLEQKVESGSREPLVIPSFPPGYEIRLDATVRGSASSAADAPRAEP